MGTAAGVTLTGTITDIAGNPTSGKVTITLANFGNNPPLVSGSSLLASVVVSATAAGDGTFSVSFYGNYQISPVNTYYSIAVTGVGSNGTNAAYQFLTGGTFDLSTLIPLVGTTPKAVSTPGNGAVFSDEVVPTGTINSTDGVTGNATFTLPHAPSPITSVSLYVNGLRMTRGIAYTITGSTITYASGYIPLVGSSHIVSYRYFS
jgi:hypothetical protein